MSPKGLMLVLGGKPKGKSSEDEPMPEETGGAEEDYAREAFGALQDGDEEGFVSAFLGAVRACADKAGADAYGDDEEEEEEGESSEGF